MSFEGWALLITAVAGVIGGAWKGLTELIKAARADALKDRDLERARHEVTQAKLETSQIENAKLIRDNGILERDLADMAHEREKLLPLLPTKVRQAVETGFMPLDEAQDSQR